MRSRWTRWLPGFPAVILLITILGLWVVLCTLPLGDWDTVFSMGEVLGPVQKRVWGFPFAFVAGKNGVELPTLTLEADTFTIYAGYGFHTIPFLADLALALAAGYIVAMAVERLVLFKIQAARRGRRGEGGQDARDGSRPHV